MKQIQFGAMVLGWLLMCTGSVVADDVRTGHVVDGRHRRIHDQDSKRDTIGIRAPAADRIDQESNTNAVNKPTFGTRGRGDRVGRDEKRAQYG